jgi:hypothetical protein
VWLATDGDSTFALKTIKSASRREIMREALVPMTYRHPYVTPALGFAIEGDQGLLALPFKELGSLSSNIKDMTND